MRESIEMQPAKRQTTQADIVFCLDATASMGPCIDGVKLGLTHLAEGLQTTAAVDFRLRLIAYRDLHDPTCTVLGEISDFTNDIDEFKEWLDQIKAHCGQEHRGAESALDALYLALHSDWRLNRTHKTIVLITDDNTHLTLHESTCHQAGNNGIYRIVQDLQELRHSMLFIVAPGYSSYVELQQAMKATEDDINSQLKDKVQKVVAYFVPVEDDRYKDILETDWNQLMKMLGQVVSATSIIASRQGEDDLVGGRIEADPKYWMRIDVKKHRRESQ